MKIADCILNGKVVEFSCLFSNKNIFRNDIENSQEDLEKQIQEKATVKEVDKIKIPNQYRKFKSEVEDLEINEESTISSPSDVNVPEIDVLLLPEEATSQLIIPLHCPPITLNLTLCHLIIIAKQNTILKCLLNNIQTKDDYWLTQITFGENKDRFSDEVSWIFEANCLHFAAKFNPEGLHMILSSLNNKENLMQCAHLPGKLSPLHVAASRFDSKSTNVLIFHGAPLNNPDINGETPLFLATLVGSKSNIIALIDKGADVNYETFDLSITPLFKART